jgi:hypothetical protein
MGKISYHGRYTVSEYALVKAKLLENYSGYYSSSTIDSVCRYVSKRDWPKVREDTYRHAMRCLAGESRRATIEQLAVYDFCQHLFDALHIGENFTRKWPTIDEIAENMKEE